MTNPSSSPILWISKYQKSLKETLVCVNVSFGNTIIKFRTYGLEFALVMHQVVKR